MCGMCGSVCMCVVCVYVCCGGGMCGVYARGMCVGMRVCEKGVTRC